MPIFEYECKKCGRIVEKFINNKDKDKPQKCKHCDINMVHIISTSSFRLKGKGWYKDGY
jgi:putative FmdB family regulatory protein